MTASTVSLASFRPSPLVRRAIRDGLALAGPRLRRLPVPRGRPAGRDLRLRRLRLLVGQPGRPVRRTGRDLRGVHLQPGHRAAVRAVRAAVLADVPVAVDGRPRGDDHLARLARARSSCSPSRQSPSSSTTATSTCSMAAAIALGFRYPAAWSFLLLTKVTPGIGLVWFAVRREWRPLAIALGFTGGSSWPSRSGSIGSCGWTGSTRASLKTAGGSPLNQFSIAIPLAVRLPRGRAPRGLGRKDRPAVDGARGGDPRPADPLAERARGPGSAVADRPAAARARAPHRPRDQVGADRRSPGSLNLRMPAPSSPSVANPPSRRPSQATTGMNRGGMSSRL